MPPPGMGVGAQPFGPSLTEQDAAAAMQEAIQMGIMPTPAAGQEGPPLVRMMTPGGEELLVDFETPDQATADALQGVVDGIIAGSPDVGKDAAKLIKKMWKPALESNGGDAVKTQKQLLDTWLKLTDFEKSMRNAEQMSERTEKGRNIDFYELGLKEMNRDLANNSTFGKTAFVIDGVYKGLKDIQSMDPMRKNAALKSVVVAIESRVSDKDMDFAPGALSILQKARKWWKNNIEGTMGTDEMNRVENTLRAIYHDAMKKQRTATEGVRQRVKDSYDVNERRGLMVAANKMFKRYGYVKSKDNPRGFFDLYPIPDNAGPVGSSAGSASAKGRRPVDRLRKVKTGTADEALEDL